MNHNSDEFRGQVARYSFRGRPEPKIKKPTDAIIRLSATCTSIVDVTDQLSDSVEVLFGVQISGGTDINSALAYCETQIENPTRTHLILITDLYEEATPSR
jgi:hypothetical protein